MTLAYGTRIDGQRNDALESAELAHRIIDSLQRILSGRNEGAPEVQNGGAQAYV